MGSYRLLAMRINKREKAENQKKVTREHIMARFDDMPYRGERYPSPLLLLPATAATPSLCCDLCTPPHVRAGSDPGAAGP